MLTPSEVSTKLKIQLSTLRKYSALLEQEGINFKRIHKNARLYTDSEYITIKGIIAVENHSKKLFIEAFKNLKKSISVATRRTPKRARYYVCGSFGENVAEN